LFFSHSATNDPELNNSDEPSFMDGPLCVCELDEVDDDVDELFFLIKSEVPLTSKT